MMIPMSELGMEFSVGKWCLSVNYNMWVHVYTYIHIYTIIILYIILYIYILYIMYIIYIIYIYYIYHIYILYIIMYMYTYYIDVTIDIPFRMAADMLTASVRSTNWICAELL